MTIQMIAGTFGYKNKSGFIEPKTPASGPFSLTEEQEERLVKSGVAKYVENSTDGGDHLVSPNTPQNPTDGQNVSIPTNLQTLKNEVLKEIADQQGIDTTDLKRNEIIAKIKEVQEAQAKEQPETQEADDSDDEDEIINDGEEAPVFDTTGAIK